MQDRRYYVDDITVKSRDKGNHIAGLRKVFDIMQAHQLKMNPTKSFLGHEEAVYYLSRTMIGAEHRYNPVGKKCLALVFAVQKM